MGREQNIIIKQRTKHLRGDGLFKKKKKMKVEQTPFQQFSMQEFPQPHLIAVC